MNPYLYKTMVFGKQYVELMCYCTCVISPVPDSLIADETRR